MTRENPLQDTLASTRTAADTDAVKGVTFGVTAYTLWGCFPLFFALFDGVPAWEILTHRILWACLFLVLVVTALGRWRPIRTALRAPRLLARVLGCALLIGFNWGIYIYAVESHHVLQASLGYFMTPLVNVALGMLILRERMSRLQSAAVAIAIVAIGVQLVGLGGLPWISICLALSFGTYGLLRKQVSLDGLSGLFVETLILLPLGLLAVAWFEMAGISHFGGNVHNTALLIASGALTALPLLAFAGAARRLRLSTVGFLMYINPTLQFLIALVIFREPLGTLQLMTFILIWLGLALYSFSAWQERHAGAR
ncbi:chloramphenicol-sensitive protein RarD [Chromohalobacter marismortui]|uniref:Chloramphenicol-sensitive protein RarD n=1 Tax=Chromohalobacter marismortui TaxID=42055 RepID=A0A4R7NQI7_9GAMM|nr:MULTISPECIES: EamA family transporter RarD [Chromohalobacter]MCI0508865.1 EamA family transporter RarD [Chromohalobacter sp.]MCI0594278.1 EamA family transporter RarD [Chromohalobacter sp.]TDU22761.1 chloramphenicol-sensitive protein RarD [Chromohalobacter marismortui]